MEVKPGVRGGVVLMTIADLPGELEQQTGLSAGAIATIDGPALLALQPELLYVQKGAAASEGRILQSPNGPVPVVVNREIDVSYLELPVLGKLQVPGVPLITPTLAAGPTVGVTLNSDQEVTIKDQFDRELNPPSAPPGLQANAIEIGALVGLGVQARVMGLTLSVSGRYRLGFTDVSEGGGDVLNAGPNRGFSVTAATLF